MVYTQPSRLTSWNRYYPESLLPWLREKRQPSQATRTSSLNSKREPITVVCISNTHCTQPLVPAGDVLLHVGDLTNYGTFEELQAQLNWLDTLPHRYKVAIGGNHDRLLDPSYVRRFQDHVYEGEGTARTDLQWHDVIYLNNSSTRLDFPHGRSLNIYGSPMTEQCGTFAFQYPPIRQVWADIIPQRY
jgi:predicted MPP superfamily phosphohydrolase